MHCCLSRAHYYGVIIAIIIKPVCNTVGTTSYTSYTLWTSASCLCFMCFLGPLGSGSAHLNKEVFARNDEQDQ
jgi:hypothetical protein